MHATTTTSPSRRQVPQERAVDEDLDRVGQNLKVVMQAAAVEDGLSPGAKKARPSDDGDGGSSAGPPPKVEGDVGIYDDEGEV